jgi:predicted lipid carrier protein YhbT
MIASADRERTPVPRSSQSTLLVTSVLRDFSRGALALVPLVLVQPILDRIAVHVATSHPDLFARLETHTGKRFLIDPLDLPFVLLLRPDVRKPYLRAHRRHEHVQHDARIAGAFFNLLDMIEGTLDGDSLFFTRDLRVSGDTEAVVALRNALDDFDGDIVDMMLTALGPMHGPAALTLSALRAFRSDGSHA